ncbi:hypothetical protein ACFQX6_14325 [Streptosporangium lutulentum]
MTAGRFTGRAPPPQGTGSIAGPLRDLAGAFLAHAVTIPSREDRLTAAP